jgi:hypothetical protein
MTRLAHIALAAFVLGGWSYIMLKFTVAALNFYAPGWWL